MDSSDLLKAAEEKMDNLLDVYTKRDQYDSHLHRRLVDELRMATTDFLELRRQLSRVGQTTHG